MTQQRLVRTETPPSPANGSADGSAARSSPTPETAAASPTASRSRTWIPLAYHRQALLGSPSLRSPRSAPSASSPASAAVRAASRRCRAKPFLADATRDAASPQTPTATKPTLCLSDMNSASYFPLHPDVLLATVRELLILDGTLHPKTLRVSSRPTLLVQLRSKPGDTGHSRSVLRIPSFLYHTRFHRYRIVEEHRTNSRTAGTCSTPDNSNSNSNKDRGKSAPTDDRPRKRPQNHVSASASASASARTSETRPSTNIASHGDSTKLVSPCSSPKRSHCNNSSAASATASTGHNSCKALATSLIVGTSHRTAKSPPVASRTSPTEPLSALPIAPFASERPAKSKRPRFRPRLPNKNKPRNKRLKPTASTTKKLISAPPDTAIDRYSRESRATASSIVNATASIAASDRQLSVPKKTRDLNAAVHRPARNATAQTASKIASETKPKLPTAGSSAKTSQQDHAPGKYLADVQIHQVDSQDIPSPEQIARICTDRVWDALSESSPHMTGTTRDVSNHVSETPSQSPSTTLVAAPRQPAPRKISIADGDEALASFDTFPSSDIVHNNLFIDPHTHALRHFNDISLYFDLDRRHKMTRTLVAKHAQSEIPDMVHASISTEAKLRRYADAMARAVVVSFADSVLRQFLGYHAHSSVVTRQKLERLLGCYLYDASHAMFAWERTEWEFMMQQPEPKAHSAMGPLHPMAFPWNSTNQQYSHSNALLIEPSSTAMCFHSHSRQRYRPLTEDDTKKIQRFLFDHKTTVFLGGMDPSATLPHAITIARLRRAEADPIASSSSSWQSFAVSQKGKKYFRHHEYSLWRLQQQQLQQACTSQMQEASLTQTRKRKGMVTSQKQQAMRATLLAPGKRRRGHRLRHLQYTDLCRATATTTITEHRVSDAFSTKSPVLPMAALDVRCDSDTSACNTTSRVPLHLADIPQMAVGRGAISGATCATPQTPVLRSSSKGRSNDSWPETNGRSRTNSVTSSEGSILQAVNLIDPTARAAMHHMPSEHLDESTAFTRNNTTATGG